MNSIFAKQKSKANLQRNAFDLSRSDIFSASAGMLLPCFVEEVNPNEHFEITPSSFLRTMPLNTAAYTRLKQNVEFYFVPYRLLLRQFPQFIVGTDYSISSVAQLNTYKAPLPALDFQKTLLALVGAASSSTSSDHSLDSLGYPAWRGTLRLLDLLGYGVSASDVVSAVKANPSITEQDISFVKVNPFRLLAYQKIYYDFYRNPFYELNNPKAFNIDLYYTPTSPANVIPIWSDSPSATNDMYLLRYRNWKKDYFNALSPYFQGADYLTSTINPPSFPGGTASIDTSNPDGNFYGSVYGKLNSSGDYGFTVANLRSAFALDKLYRLTIAAGDGDYASQIKAHYGFEFPHDSYKSTFLGGIDAPVTISEVVTTATTERGEAADIFGKGMSANRDKTIRFDSKEHGVILGIFSVVPECDYSSSMLDKFNTKFNREDYYQPEFADLGKQPVDPYEFSAEYFNPRQVSPMGYINRYAEYKTKVDKVHGEFSPSGSLDAWTTVRQYKSVSGSVTNSFFKINPAVLDKIFAQVYDGSEVSDQFLVDFQCLVTAVRPMSVTGEPAL
nr:MAG TPA: Major capsid protein [Microviridae sp.]